MVLVDFILLGNYFIGFLFCELVKLMNLILFDVLYNNLNGIIFLEFGEFCKF